MVETLNFPLVSVNMPVFNGSKFIRESIESILSQTFTDFELIIVDDGSTDNTIEIIRSFEDKRIRLLLNESNRGIGYTRNKALENSKGKYVAVLDSDDIAYPTRLEKQVYFLENNSDYAAIGSGADVWVEEDQKKNFTWNLEENFDIVKSKLFFANCIAHSAVMMVRNIALQYKYDPSFAPAEDFYLLSQLSMKFKVTNLKDVLIKYRMHPQSVSFTQTSVQENGVRKIYRFHLSNLKICSISDETLELHYKLFKTKLIKNQQTPDEVLAILLWLRKLKLRNNAYKIYNSAYFNDTLLKYWKEYFHFLESFQFGIKAIPFAWDNWNQNSSIKAKVLYTFRCVKSEFFK